MSYHIRNIPKGVYGEFSKIREEFLEVEDALEQNNPIMTLVELSDMLGAIEEYVKLKHNINIDELYNMTKATKRAFESGKRV